jgi:peptidoglycan hydrolase CwlO-like protein
MEQTPITTINDLKAQAYDLIAQMEQYQAAIRQLQENLVETNKQIEEMSKKDS